jgi:hypothetical protein
VKRRSTRIALILSLLLLGACSSTTFVYNRLDFLLPWYLGDYVDLDRSQKSYLDELLQPYLQWHRMEELPLYLELLDQIDESLNRTVEAQDIADLSLAFEEAWRRLEREGRKWVLDLGASLSDEQIAEFLQELENTQLEYEEKYLKRDEKTFRQDSYDSLSDSMQDYLGKLDATQKRVLKNTSDSMQRSDYAWLEERSLWLLKMEAILQREPGWQQRLSEAIDAREQNHSPAYRQVYEHNMMEIYIALAAVLNSRSEKQDRRLRKKLAGFREDLHTLIEQGRENELNLTTAPAS